MIVVYHINIIGTRRTSTRSEIAVRFFTLRTTVLWLFRISGAQNHPFSGRHTSVSSCCRYNSTYYRRRRWTTMAEWVHPGDWCTAKAVIDCQETRVRTIKYYASMWCVRATIAGAFTYRNDFRHTMRLKRPRLIARCSPIIIWFPCIYVRYRCWVT